MSIIRSYQCDVCHGEQSSISGWFLVRKLDGLSMQISKMLTTDRQRDLAKNERIVCNKSDKSDLTCLIELIKDELDSR